MADKSASVKISADPRGFIAGMKATEAAAKQTGAKIESSLAGAATSAGRKMRDSTGKFLKQGAEDGARGMLNALQDVEAKSKSIFQRMGEAAKKAFSGVAKFGGGFLKGAGIDRKESSAETLGKYGASALQAASAIGVKAVSDANRVLEKATRVSIGARGAGEQGVDPKMLAAEWFAITQDVKGVTADALGDAAAKYVGMTGDLKTARSSMRDFAIAAQASGANVEDVAGTAAAISQQFGITDPGQIRDVLSALIFQGKSGAFELKDAAALFPRLAAAGSSFGLDKGAGGVKTLGGLTQIAMSATGSGDRAATAVTALLAKLTTESSKLAARGASERVNVFDKAGKARDLPTVISELIAKTGGSDMAKKKAGLVNTLDREAYAAVAGLVGQYGDMLANAKGKTTEEKQADAQEQLRQKILESVNAAGSWTEVQKDAATAASTSSARMTAAWERLTGGVASRVLPRLLAMAEKLTSADGAIELFVSGLGLAVSAVEQLKDFVDAVTGNNTKNAEKSYWTNEAARDRQRAAGLQQELQGIQMSPEAIKNLEKTDPEELKRRRAKAQDLRNKIDLAEGMANFEEEKARTVNGIVQPPATPPGSGTAPVVKAEFAPKGIIDVRVTNQPGTAAPTPGYLPRP